MKATLVLVLLAGCLLLTQGSEAFAQDPYAALEQAEARAAATRAEIPGLKAEVPSPQSRFDAAKKHAAPLRASARRAAAEVHAIESSLRAHRQSAVASVEHVERERSDAAEEHDKSVRAGIGLAVAAIILGGIALSWGWFRASAAVAYLARLELGQAIGLCVGAGVLAVIVGAALGSAQGVAGAIGYAIFALGFLLPVVFVLARHSAEVQRGGATAYMRRERMSPRVSQIIAGLFAALCLIALGTAVFAGEAKSGDVTANVQREATEPGLSSPPLATAKAKAQETRVKAKAAMAVLHKRGAILKAARHKVRHADIRLADAQRDERHFTNRLAAIETQEVQQREKEERRAERQIEAEEREDEETGEEELAVSECDPNYEGACLKDGIGDYDCAGGSGNGPNYVSGPVTVVGVDVFGLDANGNGIGCEDE